MKTIPDLILDISWYYKRIIDVPLSWMEHIGSKMSVYAWNKRWKNREKEQAMEKDQNKPRVRIDMFNWGPCVIRLQDKRRVSK